ncbi:hypothetical protein H4Q26_009877 [Puccinia striiformis f. sp. tritici PST-130]|nr:hypothetical protein H4Q26_009877 [Puccinia striiformis f. sp. tritici PST-130]
MFSRHNKKHRHSASTTNNENSTRPSSPSPRLKQEQQPLAPPLSASSSSSSSSAYITQENYSITRADCTRRETRLPASPIHTTLPPRTGGLDHRKQYSTLIL